MADIQIHAVSAKALHLMIDGSGDDIARSQLAALVKVRHKPRAIRAFQQRALAAQRFRQQEVARLRMVQRGWVELIKFEVGDPAAGTPGHRDTIAGRDVRIRRI